MHNRSFIAAVAAAVLIGGPAAAQTYIWKGGAANNGWSQAANWLGGVPVNNGTANLTFTDADFTGTQYVLPNLDVNYSISALTFSGASSFSLVTDSSRVLGIAGGGLIQGTTVDQLISFPVTLNANQTWALNGASTLTVAGGLNTNTRSLTVSTGVSSTLAGVITGTANVVKTGTGTLTLTGTGSSLRNLAASGGSLVMSGGSLALSSTTTDINSALIVNAGSTVTLQNGAQLNTGPSGSAFIDGDATTAVTVTGAGTVWHAGAQIVVGNGVMGRLTVQSGGSISGAGVVALGANSGASGALTVQSGGTVSDQFGIVGVFVGGTGTATVTGAGSTWANQGLSLGGFSQGQMGGAGSLTVTNGGSVTSTGAAVFWTSASSITVNGGTLVAGSLQSVTGATGSLFLSDPVSGPALTIGNDATNQTYAGSIADAAGGPGTVVKVGGGTQTLTGVLTNTGGYQVNKGTIQFNGATVEAGVGTLAAAVGASIQYVGARVFGGFLAGPGTHQVSGGSILTGGTASNSAVITQSGAGSFVNFSNGGSYSLIPTLVNQATFTRFVNEGSGSITIGLGSTLNVADFQSYGVTTLTPGSSSTKPTLLTNVGSSPLYFNGGSRTFIGTPATAGTNVAGIDLHGNNLIVAGGLFVNNGFVADSVGAGTATIVADFGALVKGAGFFQNSVITQNGGKFQAGNSPGAAAFGRLVVGPGGLSDYVFAIDDATGTAGPSPDAAGHVSGWGLIKAVQRSSSFSLSSSGDFTWTATPEAKLTVAIDTLINPTTVGADVAGPMVDFDPSRAYSWPAVEWAGNYSGPTDTATLNADTAFDTSGFVNPVAGTFGWSLSASSLSLSYTPTPVPEPGTLVLVGFAAVGLAVRRRRIAS